MKVLCLCHGGCVHSIALKFLLKFKYGHDALAAGFGANPPETLNMLFEWADHVVIMEKNMESGVPEKFRTKTMCYNVGEDVYGNPFHPLLQTMLVHMIEQHGFFTAKETN